MYLFLVGDNRIHRYVTIDDVAGRKPDDPFIKYLYAERIPATDDQYGVVDFTPYRTKANKMMAHIILSDADKKLKRVIVFPKSYSLALGKMKPGAICTPTISTMDDGTIYVKDMK
jgi:hypothetical protein